MPAKKDGPQLGTDEWAVVKKAIKRSKGQTDEPPPPPQSPLTRSLNDAQKRVAACYVRTAGDVHQAIRAGGYDSPPAQAFGRLEQNSSFRAYVALLFETVALKQAQIRQRKLKKQAAQAAAAAERIEVRAPMLAKENQGDGVLLRVAEEIAECLEQAKAVLRAKAGDFIEIEADGQWKVDVDKVKAAAPGVIKSFIRDKFGEMQIVMGDHAEARTFLANYHAARVANGRDANRGDTRTLMMNIVLGDNATFEQIDRASKAMGDQLRALREAEAPRLPRRLAPVQGAEAIAATDQAIATEA